MERRKQKRKRQYRIKKICAGLALVSILTGIGLCSTEGRASSGESEQIKTNFTTSVQEGMQRMADTAKLLRKEETGPKEDSESMDWNLLLVNPWNKLPKRFSTELMQLKNGQAIDKRAYPQLQKMMDDARSRGLSPLICSSYRTEEKQRSLYNGQVEKYLARGWGREKAEQEAGKWIAVPGTSEHQTGLALDIVSENYQLLDENQSGTPEQKWLMENAHKYGFILRYPKEKTKITGIGYEPWHYRYVGKKAAQEIYQKGICLEEYLEQKEGGAER